MTPRRLALGGFMTASSVYRWLRDTGPATYLSSLGAPRVAWYEIDAVCKPASAGLLPVARSSAAPITRLSTHARSSTWLPGDPTVVPPDQPPPPPLPLPTLAPDRPYH